MRTFCFLENNEKADGKIFLRSNIPAVLCDEFSVRNFIVNLNILLFCSQFGYTFSLPHHTKLTFIFLKNFRFGEPIPFRGRQTLCKYYDDNAIINEQLLQIKSAQTVKDLEKLFQYQLRHNQGYPKGATSVEPYYDTKEILNPLKSFSSETCLCTRDPYRLNNNRTPTERTQSPVSRTSNAIKSLNCKNSLDIFIHLASDCYDKCINNYLVNLDDCNRKADIIERQSTKSPSGFTGKRSLKARKINDLTLANRINKLSINLDSFVSHSSHHFHGRQSPSFPPSCSHQTMSCNDTNNNNTDSTSQLKDPPKIILSDHSTNQSILQGDGKHFSDSNSASDNNSLTIPIENYYSSEARPP